jgi:hypothetical protein
MKRFATAALLVSTALSAQAQPVSTLPPADLPLSGAETTYVIQGGVSKKTPVSSMGAFLSLSTPPPIGNVTPNTGAFSTLTVGGVPIAGGSFLPITGGTLTGPLIGTSGTFNGQLISTGTNLVAAGNGTSINNVIRLNPAASPTVPTITTAGPAGAVPLTLTTQSGGLFTVTNGLQTNAFLNIAAGLTTYAGPAITNTPFKMSVSVNTGTHLTGNDTLASFNCNSDNGLVDNGGFLSCMSIQDGVGGSAMTGNRVGFNQVISLTNPTGNRAAGNQGIYQGGSFTVNLNSSDNGTAATLAGGSGYAFGGGAVMAGNASALNFLEATTWEDDMTFRGTTARRIGHKVTDISGALGLGAVQGTVADQAFRIGSSVNSPGWLDGYSACGDVSVWCITGTLLHSQLGTTYNANPNALQYGIDLVGTAASGAEWRSNGIALFDNGAARFNTLYINNDTNGPTLSANGSVGAYSSVISGGTSGWAGTDVLFGPYDDVWQVLTTTGGVITALALATGSTPPYCPSACPASYNLTKAKWSAGVGTVTVGVSWTAKNALKIAGATDKLGFYNATPIVKATPTGACAGNTGCQALRDAMGNLGLIATGSITN